MIYECKTEEKIRESYTRSTENVEKQATQAVATPHNITINKK